MATSEVNHHLSTLATRQLSRERDKAEVKIRAKLHVEAKLHVKVHVECIRINYCSENNM